HLSDLCADRGLGRWAGLDRRLIRRRHADRHQRCCGQILCAAARRVPDLPCHDRAADVAAGRPVREAVMASAALSPHVYLQAQSRWNGFEIAFWLATLLPFWLFPDYLVLASQIA